MERDDTTAGLIRRLIEAKADQVDWTQARAAMQVSSREQAIDMLAAALAKAKEDLSKEKADLAVLVRSGSEHAVLTLDVDGKVIGATEGTAEVLGWPLSEIVGQPVDRLLSEGRTGTQTTPAEMQGADRGEEVSSDRTHERADGTTFEGKHSVIAVIGPEGIVTGFLRKIENTTSRRAHEIQIQELNTTIALLMG